MIYTLNQTHDPGLRSWIESANQSLTDFPIQNLPFGVFKHTSAEAPRIGVAIGDSILDLASFARGGFLKSLPHQVLDACRQPTLNALMSLGAPHWTNLRQRLSQCLRADTEEDTQALSRCLVPMNQAEMLLPATIGNYTDFYASIHHATNVGALFRPDAPLLPNYKYVPIGYHGRASSLVVSGTAVRRPQGQTKDDNAQAPVFGPSRALDYELEVGLFIGPGNALGQPIRIGDASAQVFGVCLVNDWSARDIQKWEYQPLGPFLAKNFATSLSPWVVTAEALAPFRVPAFRRPPGDPLPLAYLDDAMDQKCGAISSTLEVWLSTAAMRAAGAPAVRLSHSQFADLYWTPAQLIAHHASNGCNLCPGDLLASGTVSGPLPQNRGCLLELTKRGVEPIQLPSGETRRFLESGDEVLLRGYCEAAGRARIGLGECRGRVEG